MHFLVKLFQAPRGTGLSKTLSIITIKPIFEAISIALPRNPKQKLLFGSLYSLSSQRRTLDEVGVHKRVQTANQ